MPRNAVALAAMGVIAFNLGAPVQAQVRATTEDATSGDEIVVTGVRVSTLDLPRLLKAQNVFRAGRAFFAPTSSLYFKLGPSRGVPLAGMTLALRSGNRQVMVPIDGEGRFLLPDIPPWRWELVHNRGAGRIAVSAIVLSAGATEADRLLGDLRLKCRAGWELAKANYSFAARIGFSAMGGCSTTSSRFAIYFKTPRPIATAVLADGTRHLDLSVQADRLAYRVLLGDKAKPNSAMVHIRYK